MKKTTGMFFAIALTAAAAPANAQLDVERFKPAVTHDGWLTGEGSGNRSTTDPLELAVILNYAVSPLVIEYTSDESASNDPEDRERIVGGRLGADVLVSVTLAEPLSIGLDVPAFFLQTGDRSPSPKGLGDVRVVPKLRILKDRDAPFGLAISAELRAPTHAGDFSGGTRSMSFAPKVILDHRFSGGVRLGVNIGVLLRERTRFTNVLAGNELTYTAGFGYRLGGIAGKTELGVEVVGAVGLAETDKEEVALEQFAYLRHAAASEWELQVGISVGSTVGVGVPLARGLLGARYTPTSE